MPKGRFEGWYFKHQSEDKSLAVIPGRAETGAFVQVITNNRSYNIPYSLSDFHHGSLLQVGGNTFASSGLRLAIEHPDLTLSGEIKYSGLTPIQSDIMGPFRFFPMECRHGVASMKHRLRGVVTLNGEVYDFTDGVGYIESDSGRSFPSRYIWVQCNHFEHSQTASDLSIMASVARIPFYGLEFWGCICIVWLNGREYRLATYNGVKILRCEPECIDIKRGRHRLIITIDKNPGHTLAAPHVGAMKRVIHESLSCPTRFRFMEDDRVLFDEKSAHASYECSMETRSE
ncbi:MAG: tocopherol cyclase family protein [Peptococcaceae bacterium]|nr:tocopherol cyclase family protein [Peptococcaceae bacterium]